MKVNGKDDIPYIIWKIKNVPNHQPVIYGTYMVAEFIGTSRSTAPVDLTRQKWAPRLIHLLLADRQLRP
jgi:hypothetical protein